MWCLYGLKTTGHFVALIDFVDSKQKSPPAIKLMGLVHDSHASCLQAMCHSRLPKTQETEGERVPVFVLR
jgi:hypothetical protein